MLTIVENYEFLDVLVTPFCNHFVVTESSSWPSSKTLCLLRLWSMIFPCSDFRHPVMTPVILLMCEYLMRCPIVSGRDIAIGSFLCSMLLSEVYPESRFFNEFVLSNLYAFHMVSSMMNSEGDYIWILSWNGGNLPSLYEKTH